MHTRSHGAADLQLANSPALLEGERSVQNRAGKCMSAGQGVKTEDEVRSLGPPEMHFCAVLVRLVLMMLILPPADDGQLTARRGLQRLCRCSSGSRIAPRTVAGPQRLPALIRRPADGPLMAHGSSVHLRRPPGPRRQHARRCSSAGPLMLTGRRPMALARRFFSRLRHGHSLLAPLLLIRCARFLGSVMAVILVISVTAPLACCSSDERVFWPPSWPSFLSFLSPPRSPAAHPMSAFSGLRHGRHFCHFCHTLRLAKGRETGMTRMTEMAAMTDLQNICQSRRRPVRTGRNGENDRNDGLPGP